jgi:hypothetical protein
MEDIVFSTEKSINLDLDENERRLLDEVVVERPTNRRQFSKPDIESFVNPTKQHRHAPPEDYDEEGEGEGEEGEEGGEPRPSPGYDSIEDEKADILNKLDRLERRGYKVSTKLNAYSDIEQLRTEYKRLVYGIETDQGIKIARKVLVACVTGAEFVNKKFDPFKLQLNGWSENVMENIDDYDPVFEELIQKYKEQIAIAPEIKLLFMIGGSAMMFHFSKAMFKGIDASKILKENPDVVKQMMEMLQKSQQNSEKMSSQPENPNERPMKPPAFDIGSLMGGFMPPPMPMNTRPIVTEEKEKPKPPSVVSESDISDIVSVQSEGGTKTKKKKILKL